MTHIYFVRHALPEHNWEDDRTRPLSEEGKDDSKKVTEALKEVSFDYAISSPYQRSMDTIMECVKGHNLELFTDDRFRERVNGKVNNLGLLQRRWSDFSFHEEGGEAIGSVQARNIEALSEILKEHENETIILGTHATALSSILNYYDPAFNCESFLKILNCMPYIVRLDFEGTNCTGKEEILVVDKSFTDYTRKYETKILVNGREKCNCKRTHCERFGNCAECIKHHKTHRRYPQPYCIRKAEREERRKREKA